MLICILHLLRSQSLSSNPYSFLIELWYHRLFHYASNSLSILHNFFIFSYIFLFSFHKNWLFFNNFYHLLFVIFYVFIENKTVKKWCHIAAKGKPEHKKHGEEIRYNCCNSIYYKDCDRNVKISDGHDERIPYHLSGIDMKESEQGKQINYC